MRWSSGLPEQTSCSRYDRPRVRPGAGGDTRSRFSAQGIGAERPEICSPNVMTDCSPPSGGRSGTQPGEQRIPSAPSRHPWLVPNRPTG